jgi:hypothetical protein
MDHCVDEKRLVIPVEKNHVELTIIDRVDSTLRT